jgi:hypothetical protein
MQIYVFLLISKSNRNTHIYTRYHTNTVCPPSVRQTEWFVARTYKVVPLATEVVYYSAQSQPTELNHPSTPPYQQARIKLRRPAQSWVHIPTRKDVPSNRRAHPLERRCS